MKLTPLADRVILKMVETEETTKGALSSPAAPRRSPPWRKSSPWVPAATWTARTLS